MQTATTYKIRLDTGSKKFTCPSCGKKTFVKMKDYETGEYLPDHVGRCDRESNCTYHFTLKQYLSDTGAAIPSTFARPAEVIEKPMEFLQLDYVEKSMANYMETNFANYLITLFGGEVGSGALRQYLVGRSRDDNGKACIFWRIDRDGNLRTGKIMCYNPETGKRRKDINPRWVHSRIPGFNRHEYQLCFFGEHMITEQPDKTIGIVESEKTAIIASIFMPDIAWIATGGSSGCKWREWQVFKVLKDREVILFPDFGAYTKQKTCFEEWSDRANSIQERMNCKITVSRILEDTLPESERVNGFDLADMLIKQTDNKGMALTDNEYPVIWDLKPQ